MQERGHGRKALLAYPSGAYDSRVIRIARELGTRGAFTTERDLAGSGHCALELPRLGLHDDIAGSRAEFLFRVPGRA